MKPSWCAEIPVMTVPQSDVAKAVTLVLPYYENPRFLAQQLGWWSTYSTHLKQFLSVILVDDCSPTTTAASVLEAIGAPVLLRQFRIDVDVRWNWLAARNIGAHHAKDGWLLLTDMDHVLPATTLDGLVYGKHDPGTIYGFSRRESTGENIAPHPNSWFMTRDMFWTVGGYDERLSGFYGTDGLWRRRLAETAPMAILSDRLIRHERLGDSSTISYLRKQPIDAAVKRISDKAKGLPAKTLTFPYHEVFQAVSA